MADQEFDAIVTAKYKSATAAAAAAATGPRIPLTYNDLDADDVLQLVNLIVSGRQLTMGERVLQFEREFAAYVGAEYAVYSNSGSSANLLFVAAMCNKLGVYRLQPGDEVLVPAVCWSTSVWPLIQYDLKPVFVDVDPRTLNVDVEQLRKKVTPRTRAIMMVHVMSNSADMDAVQQLARERGLVVVEGTCESLGSRFGGKMLGTIGNFGSFSFYYSHHMTTIEGGMTVCHTREDYELLKCLRSHGWTRHGDAEFQQAAVQKYPGVDPRYMFINLGYNVRPMDIQAVLGSSQLRKLAGRNANRIANYSRITALLLADPRNEGGRLVFPAERTPGADCAWFGVCFLVHESVDQQKFLAHLTALGIENRPIVTGNFLRQPYFIENNVDVGSPADFPGADAVHFRGGYIGLSCHPLPDEDVAFIASSLIDTALKFMGS